MKFSIRQILASAAGAVIAAVILSSFGVKGTIIGVAIGSVAATTGSALVAQSIERGHQAVKQVVVRAPESSTLLRRLGGTRASRDSASSASSATQAVGRSALEDGGTAETVQMESAAAPVGETERVEISAEADAPATELLRASTTPMRPAPTRPAVRRFSWRTIAATAGVVFVLALMFITAVELISGKPLSAIFGGSDSGTTLQNLVNPPPPSTTTPPSSTTTSTASTTTTTTSATTTTSTTPPRSNATTTTSPATSTTTTTAGAGATTTTTTTTTSGVSPP